MTLVMPKVKMCLDRIYRSQCEVEIMFLKNYSCRSDERIQEHQSFQLPAILLLGADGQLHKW
jgi:hypothetical protein